ncbi:class I SAM-dependent methyltransferase [Chloroflexota bacterium]
MTGIEKRFVNRERKAKNNIEKVKQRLDKLDVDNIHAVLELGCGTGAVSAFLAYTYSMNVYGSDFDPEQIKIARRMNPENDHLHFGVEDASNLCCKDDQFDLVVSQNVFHHIHNWEKAVREISRVLKFGGYLFWLDISLPMLLIRITKPFVKNYGLYTFDDIQAEFIKHQFHNIYYKHLSQVPFPHHHLVLEKV